MNKVFIIAFLVSFSVNAIEPLAKQGSCPNGYRTSGLYCIPGPTATPAIDRTGTCPSGYRRSGSYCTANSASSPPVIKKNGPCPSGWSQSGGYCKSNQ